MRSNLRHLSLAIVGVCLMAFLTGCSSNNKGKIEGKWKMLSATPAQQGTKELDELQKMGICMVFDFQPDGTLVVGLDSETNPAMLEFIKKAAPNQKTSFEAKYTLGSKDRVNVKITDPEAKKVLNNDKGYMNVSISGDDMTIQDDKITMKLVRFKKNEAKQQ